MSAADYFARVELWDAAAGGDDRPPPIGCEELESARRLVDANTAAAELGGYVGAVAVCNDTGGETYLDLADATAAEMHAAEDAAMHRVAALMRAIRHEVQLVAVLRRIGQGHGGGAA